MHETNISPIQTSGKDNLVVTRNHVDIIVEDHPIALGLECDSFHGNDEET